MDERFADVMTRERERLQSEIGQIDGQIKELGVVRMERQRELDAITVYENAKAGMLNPMIKTTRTAPRNPSQGRRGGRRQEITELIRQTGGLSRGELIERLGVKGDKSGEMSVSNALTALTKNNLLGRENGKYVYQYAA